MSTTFEVYPQVNRLPIFCEIIELVNKRLDAIWRKYELSTRPVIRFELINRATNERAIVRSDAPAFWDDDHYLWVSFVGVAGGTDGYCREVDEDIVDIWDEEVEITKRRDEYYQSICNIRNALNIGYFWSFRRSAGQPAIIALTYGLISSSLAQTTEGYIWSDDGAWDSTIFPALYNEFDQSYLNPESTFISYEKKDWALEIIESLIEDYK